MHINSDRRRHVLSLAKCLKELYAARQLFLDLEDLDERMARAIQLEHDILQNLNDLQAVDIQHGHRRR